MAVALAACGGSVSGGSGSGGSVSGGSGSGGSATGAHRSTGQLVSEMKTAVRRATSMHMTGQLSSNGRPVGLDLGVHRAGDLAGTITQNGVPLRLIGAAGKVYVKATPDFLRELKASAAVCVLMCGKYVQMSGPAAGSLAGNLSMANLTRSLTGGLPRLTQGGTTTVGGQRAIVLHGADGSTLDVAATGTPYPLRVVAPAGQRGTVIFSQWNRVGTPTAPPAGQVINLSQLKAGRS